MLGGRGLDRLYEDTLGASPIDPSIPSTLSNSPLHWGLVQPTLSDWVSAQSTVVNSAADVRQQVDAGRVSAATFMRLCAFAGPPGLRTELFGPYWAHRQESCGRAIFNEATMADLCSIATAALSDIIANPEPL